MKYTNDNSLNHLNIENKTILIKILEVLKERKKQGSSFIEIKIHLFCQANIFRMDSDAVLADLRFYPVVKSAVIED